MNSNTQRRFDATVDFESAALVHVLTDALEGTAPHTPFSVVVFADGPECESGRVYVGDEPLPALTDADWCVTATTVTDAVLQLRALL